MIPTQLMELLNGRPGFRVLSEKFPVLNQDLTYGNYREKFHLLLHMEEYGEHLSVRRFDKLSVWSWLEFDNLVGFPDLEPLISG